MSRRLVLFMLFSASLGACAGPPEAEEESTAVQSADPESLAADVEAISFLGDTLVSPKLPAGVAADRMARYNDAEKEVAAHPDGADALIWLGRRTAYLGRYRDAIDIYTHALTLHPDDARIYRHRGHRYLTVRELDSAISDFRRAAALTDGKPDEVEPDGLPNAKGIPTSTLQFNIWYHMGLAYYLSGDFEAAADAYEHCAAVSVHPDSKVATAYWRVLTLKRLGRDEDAGAVLRAITPDMGVIESGGYLDLLLLFKGERAPEDLIGPAGSDATLASTTAAYGVGAWYLLQDDVDDARRVFRRVVSGRDQWAAFGYIAAEAELARLGGR